MVQEKTYEVTKDQYLALSKGYSGLIFHRKDDEGKYYVKTGYKQIQDVIENILQ